MDADRQKLQRILRSTLISHISAAVPAMRGDNHRKQVSTDAERTFTETGEAAESTRDRFAFNH